MDKGRQVKLGRTGRKNGSTIPPATAEQRLAYTVKDALATGAFSSRNKLYNAIATGELRTFLDGKRRMISADALRECIVKRERATAEAAS